MKYFLLTLKFASPIFFAVGALHLIYGVGADVMLGANLPPEAIQDPVLDSQNRFYGIAFTLYGVLLYLCSTNLERYSTVLRCVLWVFFFAGIARLVSIIFYGMPSNLVLALLASEIILPPILLLWLSRVEKES
ncbi:MAG: DUF4345 domain-containing protein [Pseudomonadales bacterium]